MTTECAYELTSARPTSPAPKPQVTVKAMPAAKAGIVTVHGEVDSASARALTDAVHMSAQWFDQVVVDMGSVRLFSAAGVNALLEVDPERTALRLVCSPAVLRVIALCGLERRWELHKSVFLALAWSVSRELPAVGETHRYAVRDRAWQSPDPTPPRIRVRPRPTAAATTAPPRTSGGFPARR
jgi:anti-anti-sigma factor